MDKIDIKNFFKRNGSKILTAVSSIGVIGTGILSGIGTFNALKRLQSKKRDELTLKEKLMILIPPYIPAMSLGLSTIACIMGIDILSKKRQNAIASAYIMLNNAYKEYRKKVSELNGADFDSYIKEQMANDKYTERVVPVSQMLFYEETSQRYFTSTMEDVAFAIYHYNRNFQIKGVVSLNEFYKFLGMDETPEGEFMGFHCWQMIEDGLTPWIDIHTKRAVNCDGQEYYIISFDWNPIPNYDEWESQY